jgi:predicted nucleic acid-binding protein
LKLLVDTNVLLRAAVQADPSLDLVVRFIELHSRLDELVIAPQCLYEFWSVATRPSGQNGLGFVPAKARTEVHAILNAFRLLPDPPDLVFRWLELCDRYQVRGRPSLDVRLVAFALEHGLDAIVALNPADFGRFREVQIIQP